MWNSQEKAQKTIVYRLMVNNKPTKTQIIRVRNIKEHFRKLIRTQELTPNKGFFKYESEGVSSHFISENIDVIFVNRDGSIIELYKSLEPNRITRRHEGAKFAYIFPEGTIRANNIAIDDIITHQKWKRRI